MQWDTFLWIPLPPLQPRGIRQEIMPCPWKQYMPGWAKVRAIGAGRRCSLLSTRIGRTTDNDNYRRRAFLDSFEVWNNRNYDRCRPHKRHYRIFFSFEVLPDIGKRDPSAPVFGVTGRGMCNGSQLAPWKYITPTTPEYPQRPCGAGASLRRFGRLQSTRGEWDPSRQCFRDSDRPR